MKLLRLLPAFLLALIPFACSDSPEKHIRESVKRQLNDFPASSLLDIYKSFFQDNFGPGHIVADTAAAHAFILRETLAADKYNEHYYEPAGRGENFYRVSLAVIADSIVPFDLFCDAFDRSVKEVQPVDQQQWQQEWAGIVGVISAMKLELPDFSRDSTAIDSMLKTGAYVSHHSEKYNRLYHPHYRLIRRDIFENEILPLINATRIPGTSHKD